MYNHYPYFRPIYSETLKLQTSNIYEIVALKKLMKNAVHIHWAKSDNLGSVG